MDSPTIERRLAIIEVKIRNLKRELYKLHEEDETSEKAIKSVVPLKS